MKLEILKEKHLRFYEEYFNIQDKRKAQKGAKRGKLTGKADGYICVIPYLEANLGRYNCISSVCYNDLEGNTLNFGEVSFDYLWKNCRRIAKSEVPLEWLKNANIYFEED